MEFEFDPEKRQQTLLKRGLDFSDAKLIFEEPNITLEDDRYVYAERRFLTFGKLLGRLVVLVWTSREGRYRIISVRKANDREQKKFGSKLG
jgi:uncharacterized protein